MTTAQSDKPQTWDELEKELLSGQSLQSQSCKVSAGHESTEGFVQGQCQLCVTKVSCKVSASQESLEGVVQDALVITTVAIVHKSVLTWQLRGDVLGRDSKTASTIQQHLRWSGTLLALHLNNFTSAMP
eukprot:1137762-Pelagomonas_calceolata.AAC.4